jgi:hypothetical protein
VLIKAVAQGIPTYAKGCFDLRKICLLKSAMPYSDIGGVNRTRENEVHWVNWAKMKMLKSCDGMEFRDIYAFNVVLSC